MTIFNEPNFWSALAFLVATATMIIAIVINTQHRNQFFKKEYRDEISNVFGLIPDKERGYTPNDFRNQLTAIPLMTRLLLQHIHTSGNVELYKKLHLVTKKQGGIVGDFEVAKIVDEFGKLWKVMQSSPNPNFGACEACVQDIKLKKVSKHKKFLENSDSSMWDPIS